LRGVCGSLSPTPHFKKLTEQEKRERGDNTVSLYEPFAVLREAFATASFSTFFGPFFRAAKESTEKNTSEASLKECSRGVWREALDGGSKPPPYRDRGYVKLTLLEPCRLASRTWYFSFIFVAEQQK